MRRNARKRNKRFDEKKKNGFHLQNKRLITSDHSFPCQDVVCVCFFRQKRNKKIAKTSGMGGGGGGVTKHFCVMSPDGLFVFVFLNSSCLRNAQKTR
jgi:hypothetical protein